MNKSKPKLRELLKGRGVTAEQFASLIGITVASLYNVWAENSNSRRARQTITNLLQVQIWPDIRIRQRPIVFWPGVEIKLLTGEAARRTAQDLRGFARRRGRGEIIYFIKPLSVLVPRRANSL